MSIHYGPSIVICTEKHDDPLGVPVRFVDVTYFIKAKSLSIKDIIILCTIKKENMPSIKSRHNISLCLRNFIF